MVERHAHIHMTRQAQLTPRPLRSKPEQYGQRQPADPTPGRT
jgi:hypothetical protein